MKARWDLEKKRFVLLDEVRWVWENTVMLVVTAEDVVDKILEGGGNLKSWIVDTRMLLGLAEKDQVIVMMRGLGKYYSKTKTIANREFTAAARAGLDGASGGGRSIRAAGGRMEKDTVERELVKLQVDQGCFIIQGGLFPMPGSYAAEDE